MKKECTCHTQPDDRETTTTDTDLARRLAPEDIRPGDHVAILTFLREDFPFMWGCDSSFARAEPVRTTWMPSDGGQPLEVIAVCLPFILVSEPTGISRTIDLRRYSLVRLSRRYARKAKKRLRSPPKPPGATT